MLGHSHSLSGACTGMAAGICLGMSLPSTVVLAGFTAGFAVMPDMDKCGSGPARSLGPLSELLAAIALFTGLAWLACLFRHDLGGKIGLMLLLSLAFAAGLWALRIARGLTA